MDSIERGQRIREARKQKSLSQGELAKAVVADSSTISRLENGLAVSADLVEKVAVYLNLTDILETTKIKADFFKVGVGATIFSAPFLYLIAAEKLPSNVGIGFYGENEDFQLIRSGQTPLMLKENITPQTFENLDFATAPQLIDALLLKNSLDLIAVPEETYALHGKEDITRIASVMNTAKGAISLLVATLDKPDRGAILKDLISLKQKARFVFISDTISDKLILNLFLKQKQDGSEFESLYVTTLAKFINDVIKKMTPAITKQSYGVYIGWEPHIYQIKKKIYEEFGHKENLNVFEYDLSEFTESGAPFEQISFDLVIKTDQKNALKHSMDLDMLLNSLKISINKLNEIKHYVGIHPAVKKISKLLLMDEAETLKALRKINFELQFYPEWVL